MELEEHTLCKDGYKTTSKQYKYLFYTIILDLNIFK